jgi:hypothetical protein
VPRNNPVSELYGQFLQPHGLVSALTFTVNCGTLHRQVCAFQIMSNQLKLPQVDSNQVLEKSRMINGNRMHLSSIASLITKRVWILMQMFCISKNLFSHCHYGVLCVDSWVKMFCQL